MARKTPAGERWGAWLNRQLDARGWRQVDFIRASGDKLVPQTVSKWVNGQYAPDPDTLVVVAATLGVSLAETFRAAGLVGVADAIGDAPSQEAGARPEPADEGIRIILGRKDRTPEQLEDAVRLYRARKERLVAEMLRILDAMDEPEERADSA